MYTGMFLELGPFIFLLSAFVFAGLLVLTGTFAAVWPLATVILVTLAALVYWAIRNYKGILLPRLSKARNWGKRMLLKNV